MNLKVPYKSQWDPEGSKSTSDCGPACVSMVLAYYGVSALINDIFDRAGAKINSMISIAQLQKAISSYGYESYFEIGKTWDDCRKLLNQNIPPILLIHYGSLSSRQDKNYYGGHFIVLTGEDNNCWLVNDPDFWGNYRDDGEQHRYLKNEMELAWGQCAKDGNPPYSYLVIQPKGGSMNKDLEICLDQHDELVDKCNKKDKEIKELKEEKANLIQSIKEKDKEIKNKDKEIDRQKVLIDEGINESKAKIAKLEIECQQKLADEKSAFKIELERIETVHREAIKELKEKIKDGETIIIEQPKPKGFKEKLIALLEILFSKA